MKKRYGLRFSLASVLLAASIAATSVMSAGAATQEIAPGVSYEKYTSGGVNFNTVEFKPGGKLQVVGGASKGYVYGVENTLATAKRVDSEVDGKVIAAMNADFFTMSETGNANAKDYGVPYSAFISDGQIIVSSNHYWSSNTFDRFAIGINADGSVVMGSNPDMTFAAKVNDKSAFNITYINRARVTEGRESAAEGNIYPTNQIVLYTEDFYTSTKTVGGAEVKIKVSEANLSHGGKVIGTVEGSVSTAGNMGIEPGYMVLSANGTEKSKIQSLKDGDKIEISIKINDAKWQNVQFAIGGSVIAIKDGAVQEKNLNYSVYNTNRSRTMVGVKADGTMVWLTADEAGGSAGITSLNMAKEMVAKGVVNAIGLDGGGSTTFVGRNSNDTLSIWNTPQGGVNSPRAVANSIILVYDENAEDLPSSSSSSSSASSDTSSNDSSIASPGDDTSSVASSGSSSVISVTGTSSTTSNPKTGENDNLRMAMFAVVALAVLSGGFIVVNLVDYKHKKTTDK